MTEWNKPRDAVEDGTPCRLLLRDPLGTYEGDADCVLVDGRWYRIDPPTEIRARVIGWKPAP